MDGVFVISWESVPHINAGFDEDGLNFQVALHAGGNIEIRWGDGNPNEDFSGTAGIEDDAAGVALPATRFSFGDETNGDVAASFPSNQCRAFAVTAMGNYSKLLALNEGNNSHIYVTLLNYIYLVIRDCIVFLPTSYLLS